MLLRAGFLQLWRLGFSLQGLLIAGASPVANSGLPFPGRRRHPMHPAHHRAIFLNGASASRIKTSLLRVTEKILHALDPGLRSRLLPPPLAPARTCALTSLTQWLGFCLSAYCLGCSSPFLFPESLSRVPKSELVFHGTWGISQTQHLPYSRCPAPSLSFKLLGNRAAHSMSFSRSVVSNSFATPWTVARQAHLSMGFPRQEH